MRIAILGDLAVFDDEDRPIAVQGRNQRTLLASLATRPGTVISADVLVEAIWERRPPGNAANAVQTVVSRLRAALGDGVLHTRPPGYVLGVTADDVDASRFERLAAEARTRLAGGDVAAAGELLRSALALWRGPPLAGCGDADLIRFEAARLEECRMQALEDRFEADLALGRHAEVAADVEAAAAEHRLRERLQEQRLLVLYRCGRPAEALARYRELTRYLLDEHGVEPGRRLRDLERLILTQDAVLDVAEPERAVAQAARPRAAPVASRRLVTVVFVEAEAVAGDGAPSDDERAQRDVGRLLHEIGAAMQLHGGVAEMVPGDAVLAAFGIEPAHEDDALRAVRAAAALPAAVVATARIAGVGIATGEAIVRAGETISGRVVARARQLARDAGPGAVLVDADTAALTRAEAGYATFDGGDGVAYRLDGPPDAAPTPRQLGGAPFVNRDAERERLRAAVEAATTSRSARVAILVGQPGIGKSRLVHQLFAELGGEVRTASGRCLPYGESTSAFALEGIVRDLVGDALEAGLVQALGDVPRREQIVERIATAVGASERGAPGEEIQWAVRRLFERIAERQPLVVAFEDLHWAEQWLVDLVEYLGAFAAGPILVLVCARPELLDAVPAWAGPGAPGELVPVEPLQAAHAAELVAELLRGHDAPAATGDRIAERCGGSPLFAEQVVAFEVERGFSGGTALPGSLRTLLQARLDGLEPHERDLLGRAAVEGLVFHRGALNALVEAGHAGERDAAIALMRKGFIGPATAELPGEDAFRFRHELLREAAYQGLPKERRQRLHTRFAAWLGEVEPASHAVIGHHLRQAWLYAGDLGDDGEARDELGSRGAHHLLAAAAVSRARGALPAAASLLRQAAEMLPPDSADHADALVELAGVLLTAGQLEDALATLDRATAAARAAGGDAALARAGILDVALTLHLDGDRALRAFADRAAPASRVFEREGDDRGLSLLHNTRAQVSWFRGRCEEARIAWDAAADHARGCGEAWLVPEILVWTASALHLGPEPVRSAIARCTALVEETREHLMSQAFIRRPLALLHALDGDFQAARAQLAASADLYAELGHTIHSAARIHEAEVAFLEGDLEGSEQVLRDSIEQLAAMGDRSFHVVVTLQLARTIEAQGRHDEALALADEGASLAAVEDAIAQVLWRTVRARVLTVRGEAAAAVRLAVEACAIAAPTDWLTGRGEAAFARGVALRAAGSTPDAEEAFAEALAAYDRKGARTMADSAIAWIAQHDHPAPRRPPADATERTETCTGPRSMPT